MSANLDEHMGWFQAYAAKKMAAATTDPMPLKLKLDHTLQVVDNATRIVTHEKFPEDFAKICLLAALYHDVARFDQYLQYNTFYDRKSINHGRQGVVILKKENRLADLPAPWRHIIYTAIGLHNRFILPPGLSGPALSACQVIRDADKLDILRVMDEHLSGPKPYNPTVVLGLPDNDECGEKVLAKAMAGKPASYDDLKSVNDFRVLLGTWFFDMHFEASRRLFVKNGHVCALIAALPENESYSNVKKRLLKLFEAG